MMTPEEIEQAETGYEPHPDYARKKELHAEWERTGVFPEELLMFGVHLYGGNRALDSAWKKGALAAVEGKPLSACPYWDHRTYRGGVTFSRAFQRAWCEGWHKAKGVKCGLNPNHDGPCRASRR